MKNLTASLSNNLLFRVSSIVSLLLLGISLSAQRVPGTNDADRDFNPAQFYVWFNDFEGGVWNSSTEWPYSGVTNGTNTGLVTGVIPAGIVFGVNTPPAPQVVNDGNGPYDQSFLEQGLFWGQRAPANRSFAGMSLQNTTLTMDEVGGLQYFTNLKVRFDGGATGDVIGGIHHGPDSDDELEVEVIVNGVSIGGLVLPGIGTNSQWPIAPIQGNGRTSYNVLNGTFTVENATTGADGVGTGIRSNHIFTSGGFQRYGYWLHELEIPDSYNAATIQLKFTSTADVNEYYYVDAIGVQGDCKQWDITKIEPEPVCVGDAGITATIGFAQTNGQPYPAGTYELDYDIFGTNTYLDQLLEVTLDGTETEKTIFFPGAINNNATGAPGSTNDLNIAFVYSKEPGLDLQCRSAVHTQQRAPITQEPTFSVADGDCNSTLTVTNSSRTDIIWTAPDGSTVTGNPVMVSLAGEYRADVGCGPSTTTVTASPVVIPVVPSVMGASATYTINVSDQYGDAWGIDGEVRIEEPDGTVFGSYRVDNTAGAGEIVTFNVIFPPGTYNVVYDNNSDNYPEETSFELIDPDGNVLISWGYNDAETFPDLPYEAGSFTAVQPTACLEDPIVLNETGGAANSWSWTGPNGFTSTEQNPTVPAGQVPTAPGPVTYTVTASDGNCTVTRSTTVEMIACAALCRGEITDSTIVQPRCTGESGSVTLTIDKGTPPYTYTVDGTAGGSGDSPLTVTGLTDGDHEIVITDSNPFNTCELTFNTTITTSGSAFECDDLDGDGIVNYLDIDIDNDGITNAEEGACADIRPSIFSQGFTEATSVDGTILQWRRIGTENPGAGALPGTGWAFFGPPSNTGQPFTLQSWTGDNLVVGDTYTISFWVYKTTTRSAEINFVVDGMLIDERFFGANDRNLWVEYTYDYVATATSHEFEMQSPDNFPNYNLDDIVFRSGCMSRDTDGDGDADFVDFDSDDDGCTDAFEAGHGQVSTSLENSVTGAVGANGYLNLLETSDDSGVPAFTVQDNYITEGDCEEIPCNGLDDDGDGSIDESAGAPTDADMDGVDDVCDLDLDNDGIPNSLECASQTNVALLGTASQSSTYGGLEASKAIDGTIESGSNFNHTTNANPHEWWQVDLGGSNELSQIVLHNRGSCCAARLNNAFVFVSDTPFSASNSNNLSLGRNAAVFQMQVGNVSSTFRIQIDLPAGTAGRYVQVQYAGTALGGHPDGFIHMTEVEVFGCTDTDGDGTPDQFDLDSDDDGCTDAEEAQHGQPVDGDGRVIGAVGMNGLLDALETSPESGTVSFTPNAEYLDDSAFSACGCPTSITSTDLDGCSNSVLTLEATPAGGTWTITSTIGSVINPTTGQLTLGTNNTGAAVVETVTYTGTCPATADITVLPKPAATAANDGPVCDGENVALSATGGVSYLWSGPGGYTSTEQNPVLAAATVSASGNYTVTATDANGCTATASTSVVVNQGLTVSALGTSPRCSGGSDGRYNVTVSGGTGPYSYTDGTASGSGQGASFSVLNQSAGPGTITVTDANGCTGTASYTILEPAPASVVAIVSQPSCAGETGSAALSVTNLASPVSYSYTGAATGSGSGTTVSGLAEGNYTITVTGANGCTASTTASVTAPAAVTLTATGTDPACSGQMTGSIALSLSSNTITSYTFTRDGGAAVNGTGNNIANVGAGSYAITTTDGNGCTATASVTLSAPDPLVLTPSSTNTTAVGASDGSYSIAIAGGTGPYDYSDGTRSGAGVTDVMESGLAAGSYTVTVTDANGCTQMTTIVVASPNCTLSATGAPTAPTCANGTDGSITLTTTGATGAVSYTYAGASAGAGSGTTIAGLGSGSYAVQVTDAAGCMVSVAVIVPATPAVTLTATGTDPECNGEATGSIDLTLNAGTPSTYTFTGTTTGSGTGPTITGLGAGSYDVTVTDANGCEATATGVTLTDPPAAMSDAGSPQMVCGLEGNLEAATVANGTGMWSQTAGPGTATFADPAANATTVTVTDEGDYEFTWTVTIGSCTPATSTVAFTFETEATSDAGTDQTGADEVCGLVTDMTASGPGAWSQVSGPGTVTFNDDTFGAATATASEAGTYELAWTVAGSICPDVSDTVVVDFTVCDADGDLVLNDADVDDDNDGILDTDEGDGATDTDGDGIPDSEDRDSDNDGITDAEEAYTGAAFGDPDNNGFLSDAAGVDFAVGADGALLTTYGIPTDTDLDGVPNHIDLDSDGDGLPDTFEGNFEIVDGDNDGRVGTGLAPDVDGDGIADSNDPDFAGNILGSFGFLQDRDGDGIPNHLDLDIDNDGIVDNIEGQPTFGYAAPLGTDSNGNGLDDQYDVSVGGTAIGYTNSDGGSAPDYADTNADSEDGGMEPFDIEENHVSNGPAEPVAADGSLDISGGFDDADGDGLADIFDLVPGGFGDPLNVTNDQDPFDQPGTPGQERDWRDSGDNDNDGIVDAIDTDDDNDGIPDTVEDPAGTNVDSDGDGSPDSRDLDSDGDGLPDVDEAGGEDPDGDGIPGTSIIGTPTDVDPDNPGVTQGAPLVGGAPIVLTPIDSDSDGVPDHLDRDSDEDGIPDAIEAGGTDANGDGVQGPGIENDSDSDGLADSVDPIDNRTFTAGSGTPLTVPNSDGDANPDYLDLDSDNDGILDVVEAGGDDPDGNGLVGAGAASAVPDADGDGLADAVDPRDNLAGTPGTGTPAAVPDTDGDSYADYLDIDSDDDGIIDNLEAQPSDAAPVLMAVNSDADLDGIDDAFDSAAPEWGGSAGLDPIDTDAADDPESPDYLDTDTDNDGIPDVDESGLGTPGGSDADMDGLDDAFSATQTFADLRNTDLPGTPELDFREGGKDTDGDGVPDDIDNCPMSLPGATVDANGCTDMDGDGAFADVMPLSPMYDPNDNEACQPNPRAGACRPIDMDLDGYFANYPTIDPLFDANDTSPCLPDNTVAACDDDEDGVPDGLDSCPFTATGASVNADGCTDDDGDGFSPDAAPADAAYDPNDAAPCVPDDTVAACDDDGDGVPNGLDSCPTSAVGATVNAAGCTDEDADGFFPDIDPAAAAFDPDDMEACIPDASALLCVPVDADGDGYFANFAPDDPQYDPDDLMVCIPDPTVAACDTDGDGVADGNDLCAGTLAGLSVNADGCPDEDGDGFLPLDDVNDAAFDPDDTLPCVPDDTVGACDTDGDGVPDGDDVCPNSEAGAIVDGNGCTDFDGDGFFPDVPMGPAFDPDDAMVCIPDNTIAACDTDGDGVPDGDDTCPNSPPGAVVAMGFNPATGCIDADGDGFFLDGEAADLDPEDDNGCVPDPTAATCSLVDMDGDGFFANVPTDDGTYDPDDDDGCVPDPGNAACDSDGDGVADADDACPFSATGAVVNATGCTDADGDGFFPDVDPLAANYDPQDSEICVPEGTDTDGDGLCDLEETLVTMSDEDDPCDPDPTSAACDDDGDGVPNGLDNCPNSEAGAIVNASGCTDADGDGTFPDALADAADFDPEDANPCIPVVSALCIDVDTDNDGYFANFSPTDPLFDPNDSDPCNPDPSVAACDTDGDGIADADDLCPNTPATNRVDANGCSDEDGDGFFPGAPLSAADYDPDDTDGCNPDPSSATCDSDFDGVADVDDLCPNTPEGNIVTSTGCTDMDGDGFFPDTDPLAGDFDPNDMEGCIPLISSSQCTPVDVDGDGYFGNYPADDPLADPDDLNPCVPDQTTVNCDSDGDGVIDELDECPTSAPGAMVNASGCTDADGDGFLADVDPNDPQFDEDDNEPCVPDVTAAPADADCDGDGTANGVDPNPDKPVAVNDSLMAVSGMPAVILILDNDDYLPGGDITIDLIDPDSVRGMSVFDVMAGTLTYTPSAEEAGNTTRIGYEVCYLPTMECARALVVLEIPQCPSAVDTDGDGLTDCEETTGTDDPSTAAVPTATSDEMNPCDPDPGAVPDGDCDGDGNLNDTDPNVTEAVAVNDTTDAVTGQGNVIDLLTNDDFIPGPDITIFQIGELVAGDVTFDSLAGTMIYVPLDEEFDTTIVIEYQVCYTPTGVCGEASAVVTIDFACPNALDSDEDGLTDCEETTGIDDPQTDAVPDGITDETNACDPDPANGFCDADEDGTTADADPDDNDPCVPVPINQDCPSVALAVSASSTDVTFFNADDGTITLSITNGTAPFTVTYTGPDSVTVELQDQAPNADGEIVLTDLAPGIYFNISVSDASVPTQIVPVEDQTIGGVGAPPVLTCPSDTVILCDDPIVPIDSALLVIESECGVVSVDISDPIFAAGDPLGVYTIDYSVTDSCGQTVTCTRTLTQIDSTLPTLIAEDTVLVFLDENGSATLTLEDIDYVAMDNCGPVDVQLLEDNPIGRGVLVDLLFDCTDLESASTEVFLVGTDLSGNQVAEGVFVVVRDTFGPTFILDADQIDLGFGNVASLNVAVEQVASDNCGDVTVEFNTIEPGSGGPGTVDVIATALDESGNETVLTFTLPAFFAPSELACIARVNISLDDACSALVEPSTVLTGLFGSATDEDFTITVLDGDTTNGPLIDGCGTFMYVVEADTSVMPFRGCMGEIVAEDKTPPVLVETPMGRNDLLCADAGANNVNTLAPEISRCYTVDAQTGEVVDMDDALSSVLSPDPFDADSEGDMMLPTFFDGCASTLEVCVSDVLETSDDGCGATVITRTFTANVADGCPLVNEEETEDLSVSTSFRLTFLRPGLDSLNMEAIAPVVEIEACGNADSPEAFLPGPADFPFLQFGDRTLSVVDGTATCSRIAVTYVNSPNLIQTCPNTVKFQRTFTVVDWCAPTDVMTYTQFVKIGDSTGPEITGSTITEFGTNVAGECTARVRLDGPGVGTLDACSGTDNLLTVTIYPDGDVTRPGLGAYTIDGNNGVSELSDPLEIGDYAFVYTATDECGNQSTLTQAFTVVDGQTPQAVCEDGLNVSLNRPTGTATLTPEEVDAGSLDGCSGTDLSFGLAYSDDMSVMPTDFDDEIVFTCEDLGVQFVTLQVTDEQGNSNTCWLEVLVELKDAEAPTCIAPGAVTLTCDQFTELLPAGNLEESTTEELDAAFGTATSVGLCSNTVTSRFLVNALNECGVGTAVREYTVTDAFGNTNEGLCTQSITVLGVYDYQITLPGNAISFECTGEFDTDEVVISSEGGCDQIVIDALTEEVFGAGEGCYQLQTTYTITNLCEYDPASPGATSLTRDGLTGASPDGPIYLNVLSGTANTTADDVAFISSSPNGQFTPGDDDDVALAGYAASAARGRFTYVQTVDVFDRVAPVISDISAPEDCLSGCTADVELSFLASDDCELGEVTATVSGGVAEAVVTESSEGSYSVTIADLPAGDHMVSLTATDACGNPTTVGVTVSVCGDVAPTPICRQTLVAVLQADDTEGATAEVFASQFILEPLTDCFGNELDKFAIVRTGEGPAAVDQASLTLTCNDFGDFVAAEVYAFDDAGNEPETCAVLIEVQEGENVDCGDGGNLTGTLSGTILTQRSTAIGGVEVVLTGAEDLDLLTLTDESGYYAHRELPFGGDYTAQPRHDVPVNVQEVKVSDVVAIGRVILGELQLPSPYDYLAADVDGNGRINVLDMVAVQRVILGHDDTFRGGRSWRFATAAHEMTMNNWFLSFPEVFNVNDLQRNLTDADFVGVELGNVVRGGRASLELETEERQLEGGQEHTLTIRGTDDLAAWQGTLRIGPDLKVTDVDHSGEGGVNTTFVGEGLLGVLLRAGGELSVTVTALNPVKLSSALELTDELVVQEGVTRGGVSSSLGLAFTSDHLAPALRRSNKLYDAVPNPVIESTVIGFDLARAGTVQLTIRNMTGKVVMSRAWDGVQGYNSVTLSRANLGTSGTLTYTVQSDDFAATKRMIVVR